MFGWFKRKKEENSSSFKLQERWIYSFWDGKEHRKVDPLPIYKAITAKGPHLSIDMTLAGSDSKDRIKGHNNYIASLYEIFNVKRFEQGGLAEQEIEALFFHFWEFVDARLKKNSKSITTRVTGPSQNIDPSLDANPPTQSSSDSGSTGSDDGTNKPK